MSDLKWVTHVRSILCLTEKALACTDNFRRDFDLRVKGRVVVSFNMSGSNKKQKQDQKKKPVTEEQMKRAAAEWDRLEEKAKHGIEALFLAVERNEVHRVKELIMKEQHVKRELKTEELFVNQRNEEGELLLHKACFYGTLDQQKKEILSFLLEEGLRVDALDGKNRTFLHVATDRQVCEFFFSHEKTKSSCLALLEKQDDEGKRPLHCVAWSFDLLELYLSKKAQPNVRDSKGATPLHYAVSNPDGVDAAELLLHYGASLDVVDLEGKNILHYAVQSAGLKDNFEPVLRYLEERIDVNARDIHGAPPVLYACKEKRSIVEFLVDHGARLDICDFKNRGPLHYAVQYVKYCNVKINSKEYREMVTIPYLLEQKCDPNAQDWEGNSPCHYIMKSGEILYDPGRYYPDGNGKMKFEHLEDHWYNSKEQLLDMLEEFGASLDVKNSMGLSAKQVRSKDGEGECRKRMLVDELTEVNDHLVFNY